MQENNWSDQRRLCQQTYIIYVYF